MRGDDADDDEACNVLNVREDASPALVLADEESDSAEVASSSRRPLAAPPCLPSSPLLSRSS